MCVCVLVADLGVVLRQSRGENGVELIRRGLVVRKQVECRILQSERWRSIEWQGSVDVGVYIRETTKMETTGGSCGADVDLR